MRTHSTNPSAYIVELMRVNSLTLEQAFSKARAMYRHKLNELVEAYRALGGDDY